MIILVLFTLFLGGVGTWDLVRELRKSRWRAASKEGSDTTNEEDKTLLICFLYK